jgi:small subunit ribosomal protein S17
MTIKEKVGFVISARMDKTRIVAVNSQVKHKRYGKVITKTKRYVVHDSNNTCFVGDKVCIQQTRPLSKTKNWVIINVAQKSST